jgi:hypothetical protein
MHMHICNPSVLEQMVGATPAPLEREQMRSSATPQRTLPHRAPPQGPRALPSLIEAGPVLSVTIADREGEGANGAPRDKSRSHIVPLLQRKEHFLPPH